MGLVGSWLMDLRIVLYCFENLFHNFLGFSSYIYWSLFAKSKGLKGEAMNDHVDETFRKILAGLHNTAEDMRALDARLDERNKLAAIILAYDKALKDPQFKAPSFLHFAIERAR